MSAPDPLAHDTVFIDSLSLSPTIGQDMWKRTRPQPVFASVHLHLQPGYLNKAGASDDVRESIHYGHLCKSVAGLVDGPHAQDFDGHRDLARAIARTAFSITGAVAARRVVVAIRSEKLIPLAREFTLEIATPYTEEVIHASESVRVSVRDLSLSTIIGVNPPERKAKQRVVICLVVHEKIGHAQPVDYPDLVSAIAKDVETSSYLTLEKLVFEIIRAVCGYSEAVDVVTVEAKKPSALSFAEAAGVQMTRSRASFSTY